MRLLADRHTLIADTRIAYGVFGTGEPVTLIHGTPSSSYIWRQVMPELVDAGYRVHVYDLLGYGMSERPWNPQIDTSVSGQVPIFEGLLDHWQLDDLHIVAHDIGGAVAQRFAIQSPKRVRSLCLIDTVSFDSWPSKRTHEQMHAGLDTLIKVEDAEHRAHFAEWLLSTVQNKELMKNASLDTFLDHICNPIGQASLFQHQVRHYDPKHTAELTDRLAELGELPVQVIWGADDAWQVADWAYKLHAAIPGSELHLIPDCGHFAMEDRPEKLSCLLVDFLSRNRAQST